jgi:hypothetical protein
MKKFSLSLPVLITLLIILMTGCKDSGTEPAKDNTQGTTAVDTVRFSAYVQPKLIAACTCHQGGSPQNGFNVSTYTSLRAGGQSSATNIIIAGDTVNSILMKRLKGTGVSRMPAGGPFFADTTVTKIGVWIMQGAKNN